MIVACKRENANRRRAAGEAHQHVSTEILPYVMIDPSFASAGLPQSCS